MNKIPVEFLHECFLYNPKTGKLIWKERPTTHFESYSTWKNFNDGHKGKPAGSLHKSATLPSYYFIKMKYKGKKYCFHLTSLIYYMQTGVLLPNWQVVCADGNYRNLRFDNLTPLADAG